MASFRFAVFFTYQGKFLIFGPLFLGMLISQGKFKEQSDSSHVETLSISLLFA
jgi:hypothetical protein